MNRRKFLKRGSLFIPAAFGFPHIVKAQTLAGSAAFRGAAAIQAGSSGGGGGGGGFAYYSAVFDGSSYETRGAEITGLTDGQAGTVSFWLKASADGFVFGNGGFHFQVQLSASRVKVLGSTSGDTEVLRLSTGSDQDWSTWHHFAACWDLNSSGTEKVFVDGVDNTFDTTSTEGQTIDYATGDFAIGTRGDTFGRITGSLCELWFTNTYLDISNSTNLQKFRTVGGHPEDLGTTGQTPTGTTPLIYMHTQPPGWKTNVGSGGGFTETGTITDGGSDKP